MEMQNDTKLPLARCQLRPTGRGRLVNSNCMLLIDLACLLLFGDVLSDQEFPLKYLCMHSKPNYPTVQTWLKTSFAC